VQYENETCVPVSFVQVMVPGVETESQSISDQFLWRSQLSRSLNLAATKQNCSPAPQITNLIGVSPFAFAAPVAVDPSHPVIARATKSVKGIDRTNTGSNLTVELSGAHAGV
jgi:hypothetical protein